MIRASLIGLAAALVASAAGAQSFQNGQLQVGVITAPNVTTSQATATTTSALLCSGRPGRQAVTVQNLGGLQVFIGPPGVTTTTGALVPGSAGSSVTLNTSGPVHGLTVSGSQAVACIETY